MCRSLTFDGRTYDVQDNILITDHKGQRRTAKWVGRAKRERLQWWKSRGKVKSVLIHAETFLHGKIEQQLRVEHKRLLGIEVFQVCRDKDGQIVARPGDVLIVTRPTRTTFESAVDERWPVAVPPKDEPGQLFKEEHSIT